ncbi:CD99 antigen [Indicator indicator]|uniref:CD99 antigen n=1 Tax=Indicator indicator TaxID=1002788 RepID=UPI0023DFC00D|nr:CD99 antigen [Indicator indicator]
MRRWKLLSLIVLIVVLVPVRGNSDEFSLEDALDNPQKTTPSHSDDFNLHDAVQPHDPKPSPLPSIPKDTGSFDDSDLVNGNLPKGGGGGSGSSGSNERKSPSPENDKASEDSQGAIAGIASAVIATVIGAVSSFIAYQKKKLCFKQSADEENVNMESQRGAQSEPPVQRTLLEN